MEYPLGPDVVAASGIDPEMSTSGRGTITPAERGNPSGPIAEIPHVEDRVDRFTLPDDCGTDAGGRPGA